MHIGIDVGGTNTDAALMDGRTLVTSAKRPTSADVTQGVRAALDAVLAALSEGERIDLVAIGTTHFTNALVQAKGLAKTAALRLGLPAGASVPPMTGWPKQLAEAIGGRSFMCHGGYEFDGRPLSPFQPDEIKRVAESIAAEGIEAVAVTSIFSPMNADVELETAEILRDALPDVRVSLSHMTGQISLIERENATIMNAALLPVADRTVAAIGDALQASGIDAPFFLSQNDGTLMDRDFVRDYPVATFAAGPTNSMRGAALLSGLSDCVVVDIGGTTADIGAVVDGFPRQAGTAVDIAGVRTNFRMPDVVSTGIGGGSKVTQDGSGSVTVGPESVGYRLDTEGLVFGGSTLTATDLAVASGAAHIGDQTRVAHLDATLVNEGIRSIAARIGALADSMRTSSDEVPLVLVGGGSVLVPGDVPGFTQVVRHEEHGGVANAIGAAIAQVGGQVDRMFVIDESSREQALEQAKTEAKEQAIAAGADPDTLKIASVDEIPISYLPGGVTRIRVKAIGELLLGGVQ
jgi:N-methylhydantoinase A/oxoprolinase/acetone carboxylase beta subunit